MFDLADRPLVWIPIKWGTLKPNEKEGETAVEHEVSIELEVDIKDRDELVDLASDMFGVSKINDAAEDLTDVEIAKRAREREVEQFMSLVTNWRKFTSGGKPVEFNADNARKLLAVPGFLLGFQTAYFQACAGKVETRKGN